MIRIVADINPWSDAYYLSDGEAMARDLNAAVQRLLSDFDPDPAPPYRVESIQDTNGNTVGEVTLEATP